MTRNVKEQPNESASPAAGQNVGARRLDRIAARAFELHERREGAHRDHVEDWLLAERQIDHEMDDNEGNDS